MHGNNTDQNRPTTQNINFITLHIKDRTEKKKENQTHNKHTKNSKKNKIKKENK